MRALTFLLLVVVGCTKSPIEEPPIPTTPLPVISADDLSRDYYDNPLDADLKYLNKHFYLCGRVNSIEAREDRTFGDKWTQVFFQRNRGDLNNRVEISFLIKDRVKAKEEKVVAKLRPNDQIKITCFCRGMKNDHILLTAEDIIHRPPLPERTEVKTPEISTARNKKN